MSKVIYKNSFIQILSEKESTSSHNLHRVCKILDFYKFNTFIGQSENHHIIPKSWDKSLSKNKDNIVSLPIRVHFIVHQLMAKSFSNNKSMVFALWRMITSKRDKILNSREYENTRLIFQKEMSDYLKGRVSPTKGMTFIRSDDYCKNISESRKGCIISIDHRNSISHTIKNMIWITNGEKTTRIKNSDSIPEGWRKGRGTSFSLNHRNSISDTIKNMIWITNGVLSTRMSKFDSIPEGWRKGRK